MKEIAPLLIKSGKIYFEKSKEMYEEQLNTIEKINDHCEKEYKGLENTLKEVKTKNSKNNEEIHKINKYVLEINYISQIITEMENEEKELNIYMDKIESKFDELDSIQKLIKDN